MTTHHLDAKGLQCPLPVLRARKVLKALAPGDVLMVEATDAGALQDFPAFCATGACRLLSADEGEGGVFRFALERLAEA